MICIRSQYSIEFILVFAFSLIIILPLINIMHSEYIESKEQLDESQSSKIIDEIYLAAQTAYYAGYPSRTTLELYFPTGIKQINYTNVALPNGARSELIFYIDTGRTKNNIVRMFPFNMSVALSPGDGKRKVLIKAEEANYINITDRTN